MSSNWTRRTFLGATGAAVAGALADTASAQAAASPTSIKIVGVACSPRQGQNTTKALQACLNAAKDFSPNVQVELIELAGLRIPGEVAAGIPLQPGEKDDFPAVETKLRDPRVAALILATPVYFSNMSALCKAFLDRCIVFRKNFDLRDKVGGVIAVAGNRNGGQEMTIQSVHAAMLSQDMIIVSNGKPAPRLGGILVSGSEGGVSDDEMGLKTAQDLGRRVAEVALRLSRGAR